MNPTVAFNTLSKANQEIEDLRATIAAYEKATEEIKGVRARLSNAEQRMLNAFQAFQNGTVQATHRTVRRYKAESTINTVLAEIQRINLWVHYTELARILNQKGMRTSRGLPFDAQRVCQVLSILKKEGQVHNRGTQDGYWRYGKGPRIFDQIGRG
jgi:exonuclease VII small subunit